MFFLSLPCSDDGEAGSQILKQETQRTLDIGIACKICGKRLRNRITLRRHVRDLHYAQTEEFWCKICSRCYRTKNSLVVHTCNYHQKKIQMRNTPDLEWSYGDGNDKCFLLWYNDFFNGICTYFGITHN